MTEPKILGATVEVADWEALSPHAERGALIHVASELQLDVVAKAITEDRSAVIALWIKTGLISRPRKGELKVEESDQFDSIIVQPYVLIQGPLAKPDDV